MAFGMQILTNAASFRQQARWCRHMATLMRAPEDKELWLTYSDDWDRMADQEELAKRRAEAPAPQAAGSSGR